MGFKDFLSKEKKTGDFVSRQEEREAERNLRIIEKREPREKKSLPSRVVDKLSQAGGGKPGEKFIEMNAPNPRTAPSHLSQNFDSSFPGILNINTNTDNTAISRAMSGRNQKGKSTMEKAMFGFNVGGSVNPALTSFGSLNIGRGPARRKERKKSY